MLKYCPAGGGGLLGYRSNYSYQKTRLIQNLPISCSRKCTRSLQIAQLNGYTRFIDKCRYLNYLKSDEAKNKLKELLDKGLFAYEIAKEFRVTDSYVKRNYKYHFPNIDLTVNQSKRHSERLKSGEVRTWFQEPEMQLIYGHSYGLKGKYVSTKSGEVFHRSSYELTAFKLMDNNPEIIMYLVEPVKIEYNFNGIKNYYPDLLVWYTNMTVKIIEVKPKYKLIDEQVKSKAKAAIEYCRTLDNVSYEFWTEDDLY
jgi:hypothetical protein